VTAGTADVVASYQGLSATARIFVVTSGTQFFPLLRILTSSPETGRTLRVSADYFATPSSSRNVGAEATWTSSDPAVFTAEAGEITGRAPGTAILTATYNGAQGSSFVSVPPMRTLP
jgi:hypothetical protein